MSTSKSIIKITEEQKEEIDRIKYGTVTFVIVNGLVERLKPYGDIKIEKRYGN
jgi:hypothetical protein